WTRPGRDDRYLLDLWRANVDQLAWAGVPAGAVHVARLCTATYPEVFHSYRVDGPRAGRMVAGIRLRGRASVVVEVERRGPCAVQGRAGQANRPRGKRL